jgi:hypothetical protein
MTDGESAKQRGATLTIPPNGALPLSGIDDIAAEWGQRPSLIHSDIFRFLITLPIFYFISYSVASLNYGQKIPLFLTLIPLVTITIIHYIKRFKMRARNHWLMIQSIAVEPGHPWLPKKRGDSANVHILLADDTWKSPALSDRLISQKDPFLGTTIIQPAGIDVERLGTLEHNWSPELVRRWLELVNMALILGDSQQNSSDEDPFEQGREREETAEGLLDREWMDTTPGQYQIELGQLRNAADILSKQRRKDESYNPRMVKTNLLEEE